MITQEEINRLETNFLKLGFKERPWGCSIQTKCTYFCNFKVDSVRTDGSIVKLCVDYYYKENRICLRIL